MIKGEYLTADDLGPLGRLVAPGELRVMEKRDVKQVHAEREWINRLYLEADRWAERLRKRLATARMSGNRDVVRELFEEWTIEAAKLALCDRYLGMIVERLDGGGKAPMNPSKRFRWQTEARIVEVTSRVLGASDEEIVGGAVFRSR